MGVGGVLFHERYIPPYMRNNKAMWSFVNPSGFQSRIMQDGGKCPLYTLRKVWYLSNWKWWNSPEKTNIWVQYSMLGVSFQMVLLADCWCAERKDPGWNPGFDTSVGFTPCLGKWIEIYVIKFSLTYFSHKSVDTLFALT